MPAGPAMIRGGPPGPRLEGGLDLGLVPGQQRADPGSGHHMLTGDLADLALPGTDSSNDQPGL
ncbi:MAG TPA: hypothetical protein VFQ44_22030 [Streptosporangiaceae bacterium]|nr:hypothetical protein [Streptosporangiaceae bacterium]